MHANLSKHDRDSELLSGLKSVRVCSAGNCELSSVLFPSIFNQMILGLVIHRLDENYELSLVPRKEYLSAFVAIFYIPQELYS